MSSLVQASGKTTEEAAARFHVYCITQGHGYLDEHALSKMKPEARQIVEKSLMRDNNVSKRVAALVKNLENGNSRFSRFVFDLLQNADDNDFTRARAASQLPFVTFKVAPSWMTVDCNEDGFTHANVTALCDVAKSSRTGSKPYFSNEGIGFKSVFRVAYKVDIQSENYSFSFNHKPGQSGMGMISPTWEEYQDGPSAGITRMKLFLHSEATYPTVLKQLNEIQAVHLMFLRNIQRINIICVDDSDAILSSTRLSINSVTPNEVVCIKEQDGVEKTKHDYLVTRQLVNHPSPCRNQTSPRIDIETKRSTSEIILAFPVNTDKSPVISSQSVFALTEIGDMGFKFLIQAEFAMSDKDNDIEILSSTNQALLDSIPIAFVKAIHQLHENSYLRYEWVRYLSRRYDEAPIRKGYWADLWHRIRNTVKAARLILPLDGVSNLSANDVLQELFSQRESAAPDRELIRELYSRLPGSLAALTASRRTAFRENLQTTSLIFAGSQWHTLDRCVWSQKRPVPGKVDLIQFYSGMESTFVDALGISLNIETAYDMILAVGSSPTATVQQAKEALRRLNSLLPNAERQPDPKRILRSLIFPVRYPNGSVELSCAHQVDFGIVDQEIFEQDLRDSEEILDFTLAEVHDLHPLIKWAGLEGRFLSARTVEMTKPLGATEIMPSSQRDIRLKAHLLCRIAAHFNSRRASDIELLHHVLGQSQLFVYRSSHIITELCLVENGCLVAVDQQESGVLLDDTNGMLNIYLPRDTHRQGECFVFDLPHALYRWIMAESPMGEENPEAEFAKRLITVVLNLEPHMATLFLNKEGIAALNSLTADNISDVQKPLPQVRVRLPPVQAPEGVTNSVDKPKITENENDKRKVESIQDKPMAMFTGNGIVKAEESSPLSVFENLRITSPLPSSGQQLSCG